MAEPREPATRSGTLSAPTLRAELETSLERFSHELGAPFPTVSNSQVERLGKFLELLLFWRTRLSLISVESPLRIVREHVVDSLAPLPWAKDGAKVADLGSGGGFPGIPLAIFQPKAQFFLIESRRKRANFLREVVRQVALDNALVVEQRGEDLWRQESQRFDVLLARAFGSIADLLAVAKPLMRPGGVIVAMKGETSVQQAAEVTESATLAGYTLIGRGPRKLVIYTVG